MNLHWLDLPMPPTFFHWYQRVRDRGGGGGGGGGGTGHFPWFPKSISWFSMFPVLQNCLCSPVPSVLDFCSHKKFLRLTRKRIYCELDERLFELHECSKVLFSFFLLILCSVNSDHDNRVWVWHVSFKTTTTKKKKMYCDTATSRLKLYIHEVIRRNPYLSPAQP